MALEFNAVGGVGAYPAGTNPVGGMFRELYTCANVKTTEELIYINGGQLRAFRAPGYPQGAWALEQMMDTLAEKVGMDPVEFRLKNATTVLPDGLEQAVHLQWLSPVPDRGRQGLRLEGGARAGQVRRSPWFGAWAWPPACGPTWGAPGPP